MEGSSRNLAVADDLDSTVLRHQVQRYFSELQQESDTPLNMDFLGIKRKTQAVSHHSNVSLRTPTVDSYIPKKIKFDTTDTSLTDFSFSRKPTQDTSLASRSQKLDSTTIKLEQKLAEKEAKIVELQQKVIQVEMKLNDSETSKSQLQCNVDKFKQSCNTQIKCWEEQVQDLRFEIEQLQQKNEQLQRDNHIQKEFAEQWKLVCSENKLSHSRELEAIEQTSYEMQSQYEEEIAKLKDALEAAEWKSSKYQLEAEEAKNQLLLKERATTDCGHEHVMEQQRIVIKEMENALFTQRTSSQSQEAKLTRIPQMEREIAHLQQTNKLYRETAANELLLKEQISTLQSSLQHYKDQCLMIPQIECELKKAKEHLREWEFLAQRMFDADSLPEVRSQVEEMRRRELKMADDIGNLQNEINSLNRLNQRLTEQIDTEKTGNKTKAELEDRIRKLERKLVIVQKDRDHYRAVNEQFEKDMTHFGGPITASLESQQIAQLERLLDEYRALASVSDPSEDLRRSLADEKNQLQQQVAELTKTIETLRGQLNDPKAVSSSDTRVLHFTSNPLDNARRQTMQQLAQLEKENESLRERVRLMEGGQTQNLTLLVGEHFEQGCTPERLKELEEKLKSSELKQQRVEEVFRKYCSDFRRGIFELFGYQVDNDECGNFKLTSVFSDSNGDFLNFKYVGDGLMVMDSPFLHTLEELVQLHITNQKSIPVFLAALQIELFSRQSINSSAYPSSMLTTPS